MTHGRFSLTLLLALILASFSYARAQSPSAEAPPPAAAPATITGEGTAGQIPKFTDKYVLKNSIITESVKGLLGIYMTNPSALLHIYGPPPATSDTHGVTAPNLIHTAGGRGGATSSPGGWRGGRGASIVLVAGTGGNAPPGSTTGEGGTILLRPGVPGSGGGTQGKYGRVLIADQLGVVGIGTPTPNISSKVHIKTSYVDGTGLFVQSEGAGISSYGTYGNGVTGYSVYGSAIYGTTGSSSALAGKFIGPVQVKGTLTVNGNICATNHPCNSDARLKQGITNLNYGLRQLLQLRPVSWHWKAEPEGNLQLGLVAQEVAPVMPELILRDTADPSKPLGLNYMGLLPIVVKAIQEQQKSLESKDTTITALQAQVEQLKREKNADVEALRVENEAMKARLDALERAAAKAAVNEKQ